MPAVASHIVRWRRPRSKSAKTIRGPIGVLRAMAYSASPSCSDTANTATPCGASNAVALLLSTRSSSYSYCLHHDSIRPEPVQTRPVNGVDVPVLRFFVETPTCLAVRASAEVSVHQVLSDCPNPQGYVAKPRPSSSLWRRLFGRISVQLCSMYSRQAARSASP
jgi:hypothetical protein